MDSKAVALTSVYQQSLWLLMSGVEPAAIEAQVANATADYERALRNVSRETSEVSNATR